MEFTEVVSPSVAVPVLCVLVCAFLVFAFGFKSPAQPPSFDVFDEDGKKKRLKRTKGSKSQSNGHAVIEGESSVKPQPSPRQAVRQPAKSTSPTSTKAKLASQNADQSKKSKRQTQKDDETKHKQKVEEKKMEEKEDVLDTDGWHTIAKKDKKQKKKESEKQEVVQDETDVKEKEMSPKPKADDVSDLTQAKDTVEQTQAMEQRTKKKKEKKPKKAKPEEVKEQMEVVQQQDQETMPDMAVQETTSVVEIQIKDAMETTVDEVEVTESQDKIIEKQDIKENKNKDRKKDSPPPDDFVIPKSALEPEVEVSSLSPSSNRPDKSDSTSKSPKKKKKDKSKRREEKIEDTSVLEESQTGASGSVETSLSNTMVSSSIPPKSSNEIVQSEVTQDPVVVPESSGADAASSQVAAFDELGGQPDNWTEAKPKNKKKKARRAD